MALFDFLMFLVFGFLETLFGFDLSTLFDLSFLGL